MNTKTFAYLVLMMTSQAILLSCGQAKRSESSSGGTDSIPNQANNIKDTSPSTTSFQDKNGTRTYIVERARFSSGSYSAYLNTIYSLPEKLLEDSSYYRQGSYFYLVNKSNNHKDSLQLTDDPDAPVEVRDVSALLSGRTPLFQVSWTGDSDTGIDQFFGFRKDSLQMLFELDDLVSLKQKDDSTLIAMVTGRDELLYQPEQYPVTISLPGYTVEDEPPSNQRIGYHTKVLSAFTGYRISDRNRIPYLVKAGTEILIDSINRDNKMVRIMTKDSILIFVPFSKIEGKVQVNAAG
jgi:hypothetical protein